MREVADYIDDCITDAGRPAPAIIGHSMGGMTAVLLAQQHPDLVGNLLEGYDFISDAETSRRATDDRVPGAQDYGDWVEKVREQVQKAADTLDRADTRSRQMRRALKNVEALPEGEAQALLPKFDDALDDTDAKV